MSAVYPKSGENRGLFAESNGRGIPKNLMEDGVAITPTQINQLLLWGGYGRAQTIANNADINILHPGAYITTSGLNGVSTSPGYLLIFSDGDTLTGDIDPVDRRLWTYHYTTHAGHSFLRRGTTGEWAKSGSQGYYYTRFLYRAVPTGAPAPDKPDSGTWDFFPPLFSVLPPGWSENAPPDYDSNTEDLYFTRAWIDTVSHETRQALTSADYLNPSKIGAGVSGLNGAAVGGGYIRSPTPPPLPAAGDFQQNATSRLITPTAQSGYSPTEAAATAAGSGVLYYAAVSAAADSTITVLGVYPIEGEAGKDGRTILSGVDAPVDAIGTDGDYYIQNISVEDRRFFGPKASGVWPTEYTQIGGDAAALAAAEAAQRTADAAETAAEVADGKAENAQTTANAAETAAEAADVNASKAQTTADEAKAITDKIALPAEGDTSLIIADGTGGLQASDTTLAQIAASIAAKAGGYVPPNLFDADIIGAIPKTIADPSTVGTWENGGDGVEELGDGEFQWKEGNGVQFLSLPVSIDVGDTVFAMCQASKGLDNFLVLDVIDFIISQFSSPVTKIYYFLGPLTLSQAAGGVKQNNVWQPDRVINYEYLYYAHEITRTATGYLYRSFVIDGDNVYATTARLLTTTKIINSVNFGGYNNNQVCWNDKMKNIIVAKNPTLPATWTDSRPGDFNITTLEGLTPGGIYYQIFTPTEPVVPDIDKLLSLPPLTTPNNKVASVTANGTESPVVVVYHVPPNVFHNVDAAFVVGSTVSVVDGKVVAKQPGTESFLVIERTGNTVWLKRLDPESTGGGGGGSDDLIEEVLEFTQVTAVDASNLIVVSAKEVDGNTEIQLSAEYNSNDINLQQYIVWTSASQAPADARGAGKYGRIISLVDIAGKSIFESATTMNSRALSNNFLQGYTNGSLTTNEDVGSLTPAAAKVRGLFVEGGFLRLEAETSLLLERLENSRPASLTIEINDDRFTLDVSGLPVSKNGVDVQVYVSKEGDYHSTAIDLLESNINLQVGFGSDLTITIAGVNHTGLNVGQSLYTVENLLDNSRVSREASGPDAVISRATAELLANAKVDKGVAWANAIYGNDRNRVFNTGGVVDIDRINSLEMITNNTLPVAIASGDSIDGGISIFDAVADGANQQVYTLSNFRWTLLAEAKSITNEAGNAVIENQLLTAADIAAKWARLTAYELFRFEGLIYHSGTQLRPFTRTVGSVIKIYMVGGDFQSAFLWAEMNAPAASGGIAISPNLAVANAEGTVYWTFANSPINLSNYNGNKIVRWNFSYTQTYANSGDASYQGTLCGFASLTPEQMMRNYNGTTFKFIPLAPVGLRSINTYYNNTAEAYYRTTRLLQLTLGDYADGRYATMSRASLIQERPASSDTPVIQGRDGIEREIEITVEYEA